eukprot:EG_transcript_2825
MRGAVVVFILLISSSASQFRKRCRDDVLLLEDLIYDLARARENCKAEVVELQDVLLLENDEREVCMVKLSECEHEVERCWNASALAALPAEAGETPENGHPMLCASLREKLALSCEPQHDALSPLERSQLAALVKIGCLLSPSSVLPNSCSVPLRGAMSLHPLRPSGLALLVEGVQGHYWASQRAAERVLECDAERQRLANAPAQLAAAACDGPSWKATAAGSVVLAAVVGAAARWLAAATAAKGGRKDRRKAPQPDPEVRALKQQLAASVTQCEQKAADLAGLQKKHSTLQQEAKALQRRAVANEKAVASLEELQKECRRLQAVQQENAALRQRAALYEQTAKALKEVQQECIELKSAWEENTSLRTRLAELESVVQSAATPRAKGANGGAEDLDFEAAIRLLASLAEERLVTELERASGKAMCAAPDPMGDKDMAFLSDLMGRHHDRRLSVASDASGLSLAISHRRPSIASPPQSPPASPPKAAQETPHTLSHDNDDGGSKDGRDGDDDPTVTTAGLPLEAEPNGHFVEVDDSDSDSCNDGEDDIESDSRSVDNNSAERPIVTPACSRHWCNVASLGVAFRLPVIGCRWRSLPPLQGQILCVRRFVPEDHRLAERLALFMAAESVPWDMSLATYRDLCLLHVDTLLQSSIEYLEQGPTLVAESECCVVQYLQRAPAPLFSHTAIVLRPLTAVSWQLVWRAPTEEEAAAVGQPTVRRLAEELLDSVVLYPPASQGRGVSEV